MKLFLIIISLAVMFVLPSEATAARRSILVIPKDQMTLYWTAVKEGAELAGEKRQAEIIFRGPRSADDYAAQAEMIKDAMHHKVDAIVIAPNHTSQTSRMLHEAVVRGIKVVIIDSDMAFEERVSFVASDNRLAGNKAGTALMSLLGSKGTVLMARHKENNASTLAREAGFLDVLTKNPGVEIVDLGYLGTGSGNTYRRTLDALHANPGIDAVFVSSEINTLGMIKALREHVGRKRIKAIGFDATPEILQALRDGIIDGLIVQRPYRIGYLAVMAACDALDGKPVPKRITTETLLITNPDDDRVLTPSAAQ